MTAIIHTAIQRSKWHTVTTLTLAFWLSSSLLLDLVIMPTLFATGMMTSPDFAAAGYSIFWIFNRIELLCAALALTGLLALQNTDSAASQRASWVVPLALVLLGIALIFTYGLTPEMSALGLRLNWFAPPLEVPALMNQMHQGYWILELFKLSAAGVLLSSCFKQA